MLERAHGCLCADASGLDTWNLHYIIQSPSIRLKHCSAEMLVLMLEQEFAGASRAASCGDAPRCMYTHPGVQHMLRIVLVYHCHKML